MAEASTAHRIARFGSFEVDLRAGELRKNRLKVKLQEKPFQVLSVLLERPGELVTREELQQKLWPDGTFVDFEHSLNVAVKKLREALDDDADNPRFLETLPRHGYRFIAPVHKPAGLRLAVLPLQNLSGNSEDEYFADGMTEAIVTELGKISALPVISRQSSMHYKGTAKPLFQIASELNVGLVLEGSVLRVRNRVRISAQLIKAAPEQHLWAESYESHLKDVLKLQSKVARDIARQIKVTLTPQEQARVARAKAVDPEAYSAHLKGRYYMNQWTEEGIKRAIEHFREAMDIDPTFAPAYAGLAQCYTLLNLYTYIPPGDAYPKAKEAARKAVELDDALAEGHTALGFVKAQFDWDWFAADREFRRALELNPNSVPALLDYTPFLVEMGRFDEAIAVNQRAIELDPLTYTTSLNLAWVYFHARRYDEAIAQLERTRDMAPKLFFAYIELAWNYAMKGMHAEAISACEQCFALSPPQHDQIVPSTLGWVYATCDRQAEAVELLDRLIALSKTGWVSPYHVAVLLTGLGENEEAFAWLEKAYAERSSWLPYLRVTPYLDPLRSDPRFQDLLQRMKFPA